MGVPKGGGHVDSSVNCGGASCKPPATANYATIMFEYALVYRTKAFESPPASWRDLWDAGIVAAVPHPSQGYGLTFLYIAALLNGAARRTSIPASPRSSGWAGSRSTGA